MLEAGQLTQDVANDGAAAATPASDVKDDYLVALTQYLPSSDRTGFLGRPAHHELSTNAICFQRWDRRGWDWQKATINLQRGESITTQYRSKRSNGITFHSPSIVRGFGDLYSDGHGGHRERNVAAQRSEIVGEEQAKDRIELDGRRRGPRSASAWRRFRREEPPRSAGPGWCRRARASPSRGRRARMRTRRARAPCAAHPVATTKSSGRSLIEKRDGEGRVLGRVPPVADRVEVSERERFALACDDLRDRPRDLAKHELRRAAKRLVGEEDRIRREQPVLIPIRPHRVVRERLRDPVRVERLDRRRLRPAAYGRRPRTARSIPPAGRGSSERRAEPPPAA